MLKLMSKKIFTSYAQKSCLSNLRYIEHEIKLKGMSFREMKIIRRGKRKYGKWSKIVNTFHFLFSNKMFIIIVRILNREVPDQTALKQSNLGLHSLSRIFQLTLCFTFKNIYSAHTISSKHQVQVYFMGCLHLQCTPLFEPSILLSLACLNLQLYIVLFV